MSASPDHIRWHRRMEARVAAGVVVLVTLSLAGVLVAARSVATRTAVDRASANLQDARSAFYRLVGNRADFGNWTTSYNKHLLDQPPVPKAGRFTICDGVSQLGSPNSEPLPTSSSES